MAREVRYRFVCDGCGRAIEVEVDEEEAMMGGPEPPPGWLEVYDADEDQSYMCCSWECVEMLANRSGGFAPAAHG